MSANTKRVEYSPPFNVYPKDSFERFGDDLSEVLLSHLSFTESFRYQRVSKQWKRCVFKYGRKDWFCVFHRRDGIYVVDNCSDKRGKISDLTQFKKLRKLSINLCPTNDRNRDFVPYDPLFVESLYEPIYNFIDDQRNTLESLQLIYKCSETYPGAYPGTNIKFDILQKLTHLKNLEIYWTGGLNINHPIVSSFNMLSTNCPQLKRLVLSLKLHNIIFLNNIHPFPQFSIFSALNPFKCSLKRLNLEIYSQKGIERVFRSQVFRDFEQLTYLSIEFVSSGMVPIGVISDEFFVQIDQYLPRIHFLYISHVSISINAHICLLKLANLADFSFEKVFINSWLLSYEYTLKDVPKTGYELLELLTKPNQQRDKHKTVIEQIKSVGKEVLDSLKPKNWSYNTYYP